MKHHGNKLSRGKRPLVQLIRFIEVPCRVLSLALLGRETVSQITVSPTLAIPVFKVLPPESLEHVEEVNAPSWMQCRNRPFDFSTLEPRRATRRPRRPGHEALRVLVELFGSGSRGAQPCNILRLQLSDDPYKIFCNMLRYCEDGTVSNGSIGPEEG